MEKEDTKEEAKGEKSGSDLLSIYGKDCSETEYAAWIKKQVTEHPVVKVHHGKWKELLEWVKGNQFSIWDQTMKIVKPVDLRIRKKQVVVNFMKPLVETIESKINLTYSVAGVPNSSEMKDIKGSAVSSKLIAYNDEVNSIEDLMEDMKHDLTRIGVACVKSVWDKSRKGWIAPREGGRPNTEKASEEDGEVVIRSVSPFMIRPDPTAKKPEDIRWNIELMEIPEGDLLEMYPDCKSFLGELDESDATKYVGTNEKLSEKDKNEKTYFIYEYWEKKSKQYPKGRYIVTCANHVLFKDVSPAPKAIVPYFFFFYTKDKTSFWANGAPYFVQDLQREYNRMVSIQAESIEAWRPKILVGKGAMLRDQSMTMDDFELVQVDYSRGEPRPFVMPPVSAEVGNFRDFLLAAKDMVSNVHEVSYSRLPQYASRAPASLYEQMLDQENQKLDPMVRQINKTILAMARYRLMLMDKHYTLPRMVRVVGQNKRAMIEYFDKTDLAENFDVRLEIGASINQSQATTTRILFELWDKGIFAQEDRNRIIRALNFGTAENDFLTDVVDADRAMRENQLFMDGKGSEVHVFIHDDHSLHLQYHTNLLKTEEAENWPQEQFTVADKHCQNHLIFYMQLQAGMNPQGAQAGQPGANTGVPAPPGPGAPTGNMPGPPPAANPMEGGAPTA